MTRNLRVRPNAKRWLIVALVTASALVTAPFTVTAASGSTIRHAAGVTRFHPFTLYSPDFRDGGFLPVSVEFGGPGSKGSGCSGKNLAPRLVWFNVPAKTKSFTLTINDVDAPVAGGFHHWIVYNIPRSHPFLAGHGHNPFSEGKNSYGTIGYGGPCPPPDGQVHHYVFTVYALSVGHITGVHLTFYRLLRKIAPYVVGATSRIGKFRLPLHS
jgi:Raf kinase inhibitor-like YbhB/YbcL family protein